MLRTGGKLFVMGVSSASIFLTLEFGVTNELLQEEGLLATQRYLSTWFVLVLRDVCATD